MRNVKPVRVGECVLDGRHIYIQSMLNMRSDDIEGSVRQAVELEKAGCEIVRCGRLADSAFLVGEGDNIRYRHKFDPQRIPFYKFLYCNYSKFPFGCQHVSKMFHVKHYDRLQIHYSTIVEQCQ